MKVIVCLKGGPGSGHHGHKGRKGQRGGSAPGKGRPTWTSEETSALHDFTWMASETINSELREGNLSTNKPFGIGRSRVEDVELIDSAISKALPTKEDQVLYSRMEARYLIRGKKLNEGEIIHNPGYLSTTTKEGGVLPYPGKQYTAEAVLELEIPKGTRGVLPLRGVSHYPGEDEHLIRRGSSYEITSVDMPEKWWSSYSDRIIIRARLVPTVKKQIATIRISNAE